MKPRKMQPGHKIYKLIALLILIIIGITLVVIAINSHNTLLLHTQGLIANQQRRLIITSLAIMLIIVIPLFSYAGFVAFKFRDKPNYSNYNPEWSGSSKLQAAWWAFPSIIIAILSVFVWKNAHNLDPFKPIQSDKQPIIIQVVALQWKWLFIYPEQNIATVNFVEFPAQTPVDFELTSDPLMNSFWIPQLGGQMYAMAGMTTHLHLMADSIGVYDGSAAEINGEGFAGMRFKARAVADTDFNSWVNSAKSPSKILSLDTYNNLTKNSENNPVETYSQVEKNLYDQIVFKYMNH